MEKYGPYYGRLRAYTDSVFVDLGCQFNTDELYKALDGSNKFIESSQINDNQQKQLTRSVEIITNAVNQLTNQIEALK
jgi:hypothetical protein